MDILNALRKAGEVGISGADLALQAHVSRATLSARIRELRSLGYDIHATPHQGYRLINSPDLLHADDLLARLGKKTVIGRDIRVFQETTSTNDVIEKLARDGVKEGVVVFAESQTRGRGRLGRKWASPAGKGLWFSVLLRPDLRPTDATQITVAAATAVRRAITSVTGLEAQIKWPNDILVNGKKIAGILTELHAELDQIKYLILGVGVDVNLNLGDLPAEVRRTASSLKLESGQPVPRPELAAAVLRELDRDYAHVRDKEFESVAGEWEQHSATVGREVLIRIGQREFRGRAEALSESGELLLRTEHGRLERIVGGDLTLES